MNKEAKVSVVIPTYKRNEVLLERAISSILNQTYKNVEVIVVDDNPSDSEFRSNISNYMKKYNGMNNIIYLKNSKNVGGSSSRNNGIYAASGSYVTFLDDDDEYLAQKIEKQLEFMIEHDLDMSFTNLQLVNNNKIVVDYREYSSLKSFDKQTLLKYHLMYHLTGTPTFMYKTNKIIEIGVFDDVKMGQEFFLMLKSIEKNLKIGYLDSCDVIAYRHNEGGISYGQNKIRGENSLFDFKKKYFNLFGLREKMYIRFRHYAVLAFAFGKNKQYLEMIVATIRMILSSPIDLINEIAKKSYVISIKNIKGN